MFACMCVKVNLIMKSIVEDKAINSSFK